MTLTLWSNNSKHEFIIRDGDTIVARSGLVHSTRAAAKRAAMKAAAAL
jgi:quercetin dioxygenase-like cupin family protein